MGRQSTQRPSPDRTAQTGSRATPSNRSPPTSISLRRSSHMFTALTIHRAAIATSLAIVAVSAAIIAHVGALHASPVPAVSPFAPGNHWLKASSPSSVEPSNHSVKDADVDAVLTFSGATTFY